MAKRERQGEKAVNLTFPKDVPWRVGSTCPVPGDVGPKKPSEEKRGHNTLGDLGTEW